MTEPLNIALDRSAAFERARHLLPDADLGEQLRLAEWMAAGDDKFSTARVERVARELANILGYSYALYSQNLTGKAFCLIQAYHATTR